MSRSPCTQLTDQYKSEKDFSLAIVLKDGDLHIGNCGLHQIDYQNRNAEFGIMLGEKEHWGHGYAPEAAKVILQYGFDELNLHRIALEVYSHNKRAQRAYAKAGFTHEGSKRESYFRGGHYHDTIIMGILRSEWREDGTPFWSDKDRLFVFWGLGMSLNVNFIARKLGIAKPSTRDVTEEGSSNSQPSTQPRQDHLREQIEASKYEERRR